jgi:hypothetical protein
MVAFNDCVASDRFKDLIQSEALDGMNAGVNGTPTSYILLNTPASSNVETAISQAVLAYHIPSNLLYLTDDKKVIVMVGALPEAIIKSVIDSLLVGTTSK